MVFTEAQIERYARHIILKEIGGTGQTRLLQSAVLVVGAGGLGAPLLMYLAAAGVGRIGVVDDDAVELSNLQRQVIHGTPDIGRPKALSAADAIARINPEIKVDVHEARLGPDNVAALLAPYDVVADGSDNFATRYLLNDACHAAGKTLVSAAMLRFEAQISTFKSGLGAPHPCYRCLFPAPPPPGTVPSCGEAGIVGALAGTVGSLQATEVVKELLGIGESLSGRFLVYDALATDFRVMRFKRDPCCPTCGAAGATEDAGAAGAATPDAAA